MIFRTIGLRLLPVIGLAAVLAAIGLAALLGSTPAVTTAHPEPTPTTPPPTPQNPRAADGARPGVVTVSWDALSASQSAFYRVGWVAEDDYRAVTAAGRNWLEAFAFVDVENSGQTSHTVSRLTPCARYAFIVGSISQRFGTATWSEWARLTLSCSIRTPTPTPTHTPTPPPPPPPPPTGGRYTQISAGKLHTCGVQLDGTVHCWGDDGRGQSSPPEGEFLQVSAGGGHSCGVKADSTIVCWGSSAVPSPPDENRFSAVSAGDAHACGLTVASENNRRKVVCWGAAGVGRTNDFESRNIETVSSGDNHNCTVYYDGNSMTCWGANDAGQRTSQSSVTAVTAGGKHTCWLSRDGTVGCRGSDTSGQSTVPTAEEGAFDQNAYTYRAITAGGTHTCAIDAAGNAEQTRGAARCWGSDSDGQSTPPSDVVFDAITAGGSHTCGLRSNGTVACWGDNTHSQAPRNLTSSTITPTTTPLTGRYTQISAGRLHTCGVRVNGTIHCWGVDGRGQSSPPEGEFLQVSAGGVHSCGVKADSTIVCWGSAAVPSPPANQRFSHVSAGDAHACGLTVASENNRRKVVCWGAAGVGRTNDFESRNIETVSSGDNHNCTVYYDGNSMTCWGANDAGQRTSQSSVTAVTAGGKHTCWLSRDGTVGCRGSNTSDQSAVPTAEEGAFDQSAYTYRAITAGGAHTCAIDADGNAVQQTRGVARCWGNNLDGQSTPPSGVVFDEITAGGSHTCGRRGNGVVTCWGENTYGQAPR